MTDTGKMSDSVLEYITKTWRELLTEPGRPSYVIIVPEAYDGFVANDLNWLRDINTNIRMTLLPLPVDALRELSENWDFQLATQGRANGPTRVALVDALGNLTAHIELPPGVFIAKLPLPADSVIIAKHEAVLRTGWREETA